MSILLALQTKQNTQGAGSIGWSVCTCSTEKMLLLMNCSCELESLNKNLGKGFGGYEYSTQLCSDRIMSSQYDLINY